MRRAAAMHARITRASTTSPVERRLLEWGLVYGTWPERGEAQEDPAGESPIARVVVDRTREGDIRDREGWRPCPRINITRRQIQKMIGGRVPTWAGGDPIRAPRQPHATSDHFHPPAEAEEVERVVLRLLGLDRRAGLALRAHYCLLGRRPKSERIAYVASRWGQGVSRHAYAGALARGRAFVSQALRIAC